MKTISDHLADIVGNSVEAHATLIEIIVTDDNIKDIYVLEVIDDGYGMNEEMLKQVASPFFTTRNTRRVGLGIPLLKQNATASNGTVAIQSEVGKGTSLKATFQLSHIDRPPAGDIPDSLYLMFMGNPGIRFIYRHNTPEGSFEIDSAELIRLLNGVSLQVQPIKKAVIELISNNLADIKASK